MTSSGRVSRAQVVLSAAADIEGDVDLIMAGCHGMSWLVHGVGQLRGSGTGVKERDRRILQLRWQY
ncbi:hypothetical protein DR950_07045 [Kitasatospora xanthocidica]|uniref:Uncharacterized protein n=1 Tax=Kitasatospora xanthocidica TaxID=83382 RepID=A0A372ZNV5_9ACTN|nr:hypothetical protein DR950_07045 [Kitasatospora xanthocidica]